MQSLVNRYTACQHKVNNMASQIGQALTENIGSSQDSPTSADQAVIPDNSLRSASPESKEDWRDDKVCPSAWVVVCTVEQLTKNRLSSASTRPSSGVGIAIIARDLRKIAAAVDVLISSTE